MGKKKFLWLKQQTDKLKPITQSVAKEVMKDLKIPVEGAKDLIGEIVTDVAKEAAEAILKDVVDDAKVVVLNKVEDAVDGVKDFVEEGAERVKDLLDSHPDLDGKPDDESKTKKTKKAKK